MRLPVERARSCEMKRGIVIVLETHHPLGTSDTGKSGLFSPFEEDQFSQRQGLPAIDRRRSCVEFRDVLSDRFLGTCSGKNDCFLRQLQALVTGQRLVIFIPNFASIAL